MALLVQDFRSDVVRRAAKCLLTFAFELNACCQSKITDLDLQIIVKEKISKLQIAMDNVHVVQVFDAADDLVNVVATFVVSNGFSSLVQLHHRPALAQLQHDIHIERIIEEAMEADDVLMLQRLVNLDLLSHFLLLIVLHHQLFRDDLAGKHVVCQNINNLVALRKATLKSEEEESRTLFFVVGTEENISCATKL